MLRRLVFALTVALFARSATRGADVSVAAAANLTHVMVALEREFTRATPDVHLVVTLGASGNLFAQIKHGAPFDVFLSADADYPAKLVADDAAPRDSLCTFAIGRLALWTAQPNADLRDVRQILRSPATLKIAIAQPQTAPYGSAAVSALHRLGVWGEAERKLVIGENIAQTAQFVATRNADCGFVTMSLLLAEPLRGTGTWVEVPPELYRDVSLEHTAVLTRHGQNNEAARRWVAFLRSAAAKKILEANGYRAP
jgi:molybdate transport system substrate-binding protein